MVGFQQIIVAVIAGVTAITASFFTAQATANTRASTIDTQVQVLNQRQDLQYKEVKEGLERIEEKVDEITKAVK